MKWHVLYVNSRAEKKVSERLENKGYEIFCPLRTELRQWSDRKKKVKVPYFPSYVFVRFKNVDQLSVLQTPGVVGPVYYLHRLAVIRDSEMEEVMDFFKTHDKREITCTSYPPGTELKISRGVLKEKEGRVVKEGKYTVILEIKELGFFLSAEVPKSIVAQVK